MDAYVETTMHYWRSNFVVAGLVDDEFEGVAEVAIIGVEVEVMCPQTCQPMFLACLD